MKVSIHHCKSLFFGLGIVLAWIHCVSVLGLAGMGQLSFSLALAGFFAGILKGSQYQKKLSWSLQGAQFILMGICCVIYLIVSLFFQSLSQSLIFLPMLFGSGLVPTKNRPFQDLIGIGITAFFLILFYTQIRYTNDAALAALQGKSVQQRGHLRIEAHVGLTAAHPVGDALVYAEQHISACFFWRGFIFSASKEFLCPCEEKSITSCAF